MWYSVGETCARCFETKGVGDQRVFGAGLGGEVRGSTNDGGKARYADVSRP